MQSMCLSLFDTTAQSTQPALSYLGVSLCDQSTQPSRAADAEKANGVDVPSLKAKEP